MKQKQNDSAKTKILFHGCMHEYQDTLYGAQKRVCNQTTKTPGNVYRCTVCGGVIS